MYSQHSEDPRLHAAGRTKRWDKYDRGSSSVVIYSYRILVQTSTKPTRTVRALTVSAAEPEYCRKVTPALLSDVGPAGNRTGRQPTVRLSTRPQSHSERRTQVSPRTNPNPDSQAIMPAKCEECGVQWYT